MLRAHTSAHQAECMRQGLDAFVVAGDVYRRDEIDRRWCHQRGKTTLLHLTLLLLLLAPSASHYPVFHQMEGVRLFEASRVAESTGSPAWAADPATSVRHMGQGVQPYHTPAAAEFVGANLKQTLTDMIKHLFGDVEMRWVDAEFPFTSPSWELEIFFEGEWLEILGCGVVRQEIVHNAGVGDRLGWAFGIGSLVLCVRWILDAVFFVAFFCAYSLLLKNCRPGAAGNDAV